MSGARRKATQGLGGLGGFAMLDGAQDVASAPEHPPEEQGRALADEETPVVERVAADPASHPREKPAPASVAPPAVRADTPSRRRRIRERRVGMERLYNGDIARTTITMPAVVDDALAEIVFSQRRTTRRNKNDLMLEGIELVLKKYGRGSISTLVKQSEEG